MISDYFKLLDKNEYIINKSLYKKDEEYVSYDVKYLLTNIPLKGTIHYMIDQIFMQKKFTPICAKLIFKRFLSFLLTGNLFFQVVFTNKLMDIHWVARSLLLLVVPVFLKLENDIVVPLKPKFNRIYVDSMFNRRKVNMNDILFEQQLNNYNPKIRLMKLNPKKFLETKLICINGIYNTKVNGYHVVVLST